MSRTRVSKKILRTGVAAALALTMCPLSAFAADDESFAEDWNYQPRYDITAPVALVFGADGNGWDKGSTEMPKATGTFKNRGSDVVAIQAVQYLPVQPTGNDPNAFKGEVKDAVKSVTITEPASKEYPDQNPISHEIKAGTTKDERQDLDRRYFLFTKDEVPEGKTTLNYELDLDDKLIKDEAFDGGQTSWPIGKIKYVFETSNMWVTDKRDADEKNYVTYTLSQVKDQALQVARANEKTEASRTADEKKWLDMYTKFATYPTSNTSTPASRNGTKNYACIVKLGGVYSGNIYDLNIIGVNQDTLDLNKLTTDQLSTDKKSTEDGRTKAGITFMFENIITYTDIPRPDDISVADRGWEYRPVYSKMQNSSDSNYGPIYSAFGSNSYSDIKSVTKGSSAYSNEKKKNTGTRYESSNQLFIPSYTEITGGTFSIYMNYANAGDDVYTMTSTLDGFLESGSYSGQYLYYGNLGVGITNHANRGYWWIDGGWYVYSNYAPDDSTKQIYLKKTDKSPTYNQYHFIGYWWLRTVGIGAWRNCFVYDTGLVRAYNYYGGGYIPPGYPNFAELGVVPCFCL